MKWSLIAGVIILLGMLMIIISNFYYGRLVAEWENRMNRNELTILRQRVALEKSVETSEFLHQETFELMGDVLTLETERDYWRKRALSMQRELYHDGFFEEE